VIKNRVFIQNYLNPLDNDSAFIDSFRESTMLTDSSIAKLGYYLFVLMLFNLLNVAFLGLGFLITVPLSVLAMTSLGQDLKFKKASG